MKQILKPLVCVIIGIILIDYTLTPILSTNINIGMISGDNLITQLETAKGKGYVGDELTKQCKLKYSSVVNAPQNINSVPIDSNSAVCFVTITKFFAYSVVKS